MYFNCLSWLDVPDKRSSLHSPPSDLRDLCYSSHRRWDIPHRKDSGPGEDKFVWDKVRELKSSKQQKMTDRFVPNLDATMLFGMM